MKAASTLSFETVACCFCDVRRHEERYEEASDYITGETFSVVTCTACGLAVTTPQPSSMDRFYPVRYRRYSSGVELILRTFYGWRASRWVRRLGRSGRVLEVGCGDGWMLRALRDRGWQVIGFERSAEAVRRPRSRHQLPVFAGDLDAVRPDAAFDAIVLFQVLEHLPDPQRVLRQCADRLKAGGSIIIAVPNFKSWQARLFRAAWFHLDVPRHRSHFTEDSLGRGLARAGLRVVESRFVSIEHDPYGWVQSTLNWIGYPQNELTKGLMGLEGSDTSSVARLGMTTLAVLLAVPAVAIAVVSWMARDGAIMEIRAVKA